VRSDATGLPAGVTATSVSIGVIYVTNDAAENATTTQTAAEVEQAAL